MVTRIAQQCFCTVVVVVAAAIATDAAAAPSCEQVAEQAPLADSLVQRGFAREKPQRHQRQHYERRSVHEHKPTASASALVDKLPVQLLQLGLRAYGTKEDLTRRVADSDEIRVFYAGVNVTLRMRAGDNAVWRYGKYGEDGSDYNLQNYTPTNSSSEIISVIDLGGNYGIVTIALCKKFAGRVRAVVVEPLSDTYFFLRWNLQLNGIDVVEPVHLMQDRRRIGVATLNRGVAASDNEVLKMCGMRNNSMNSASESVGRQCDCSKDLCSSVQGLSMASLMDDYLDKETIHLIKMDCEGCEIEALPALANRSSRVRRLVGELHLPQEKIIDLACRFDQGKFMTKVCKTSVTGGAGSYSSGLPLGCTTSQRAVCKW